jgi:imidazolonepropionase-like amidohydrolase
MAHRAGVKIGSGSDLVGPFQHLKGRELVLKAEIMGPMGAIIAATRTNAEMMGLAHLLGTIEPGKWADLIAVDGNPLEDPSLFERGRETVMLVMKQGKILKEIL